MLSAAYEAGASPRCTARRREVTEPSKAAENRQTNARAAVAAEYHGLAIREHCTAGAVTVTSPAQLMFAIDSGCRIK